MSIIEVNSLTKDYGHGRGVFDVSFDVGKGMCFGFLGPNGAGKTTTIRHLMGFSKPQQGSTSILNMDCWKEATRIKEQIGYLPGEIALPKNTTGAQFLKMMSQMRCLKSEAYLKELLERFDFDPKINIDDMSLGEKRKLAVVTAFMHDPEVLILDEPTSGLDPIMQQVFIDYILAEKKRGKTILLSSHIFPAYPTGTAFLKAQADMLGVKDFTYMNRLIKLLQLDPTANLKRMSKGMKQKTAIVAALMGDKEILILDEPTTGLDPLMRDVFLDLIREEKKKGRTIFMSSQIIEEMEEVCDKVAVINDGHIIGILDAWGYRHENTKHFTIEFSADDEADQFKEQWQGDIKECEDKKGCRVSIQKDEVGRLLSILKKFNIIALHEKHDTLEDAFRTLYLSEIRKEDV